MPWLILICIGLGAHWQNQRSQSKCMTVLLDQQMPSSLKFAVIEAITNETEEASLRNFADKIGTIYPIAAYELRCRAWVLSDRTTDFPTFKTAALKA
jgi:DNA-binding NarL/FixJ family response regulator